MGHSSDTDTSEALLPKIDQAMQLARLIRSIDNKGAVGEPLSTEEVRYLFQLDKPIYERTRDVDEFYEMTDDPVSYRREEANWQLVEQYSESVMQQLGEQYGADAVWMLDSYETLLDSLPELLQKTNQATLLAENLKPRDRFENLKALQAAGADINLAQLVEELKEDGYWYTKSGAQYIRENVQFFKGLLSDNLILYAYKDDGSILENIQFLFSIGIERSDLISRLPQPEIEENFDRLVGLGFPPAQLIARCSDAFITTRFEDLYELAPEDAKRTISSQTATQDGRIQRILYLHQKNEPLEDYIEVFLKAAPTTAKAGIQKLLDAGVNADSIADRVGEEWMVYYVQQLVDGGADRGRIKARLSDYAILSWKDTLRKAGIEVVVAEHTRVLPASEVMRLWLALKGEEIGETTNQLLDRFEGELDEFYVRIFLEAGADIGKVIRKVPDEFINVDAFYDRLVEAGVDRSVYLPKLTKEMRKRVLQDSPDELKSEEEAQALAKIAKLSEYELLKNINELATSSEHANLILDRMIGTNVLQATLESLLERGANPELVFEHMDAKRAYEAREKLVATGIDVKKVYEKAKSEVTRPSQMKFFFEQGIGINELMEPVPDEYIKSYFIDFVEMGADAMELFKRCGNELDSMFVKRNHVLLLKAGVSADVVAMKMASVDFIECIGDFIEYDITAAVILNRFRHAYPGRTREWYEEQIRKVLTH